MAAFANTNGGAIFIGVADDGSMPGLSGQDVARINQLISNGANQLVRSPLAVQTANLALENGRIVIVLTVPKGIDKPYFDKHGVIWLKAGADKRRVNSKEELRRLFQFTNQFHADERIAEKLEELESSPLPLGEGPGLRGRQLDVEQRLEQELKRDYHIITAGKRLDQRWPAILCSTTLWAVGNRQGDAGL